VPARGERVPERNPFRRKLSNNREAETPEENKAIVQESIAYSVNEPDKTITIHIEARTFPNWKESIRNDLSITPGTNSTSRILRPPPVRDPINRSEALNRHEAQKMNGRRSQP
jgi:hypothetical protein